MMIPREEGRKQRRERSLTLVHHVREQGEAVASPEGGAGAELAAGRNGK